MDLIPDAQAQAAEATKAAVDAGAVFLDRGVLGAACVFLLIAVGVLFWLLQRSNDRNVELVKQSATVAEQSKDAADDNAEATKGLTAAIGALTTAIQTLAREAEGDAREGRHGVAQLAQIVTGNAELLRELRGFLARGRQ